MVGKIFFLLYLSFQVQTILARIARLNFPLDLKKKKIVIINSNLYLLIGVTEIILTVYILCFSLRSQDPQLLFLKYQEHWFSSLGKQPV